MLASNDSVTRRQYVGKKSRSQKAMSQFTITATATTKYDLHSVSSNLDQMFVGEAILQQCEQSHARLTQWYYCLLRLTTTVWL
jgi:hypothetical protein